LYAPTKDAASSSWPVWLIASADGEGSALSHAKPQNRRAGHTKTPITYIVPFHGMKKLMKQQWQMLRLDGMVTSFNSSRGSAWSIERGGTRKTGKMAV
jgi:hypothetical protein